MAQSWPSLLSLYLLHILLLIAPNANAQYPTRPRVPGVALQLTPDYGLASIYLKNGTSIPIAKINGSPQYQSLMRGHSNIATPSPREKSFICTFFPLSPVLNILAPSLSSVFDSCHPPDVLILKPMLEALNAAVKSHLDTNICFTALILPYQNHHITLTAQEALHTLGLRQVLGTQTAGKSEVRVAFPNAEFREDLEPKTVLAVDWSGKWFAVGVFTVDEMGIVDPVLGVGGLYIDRRPQIDAFKSAVQNISENFLLGVQGPTHLVLYGDDAETGEVVEVVESVFGVEAVRDVHRSKSAYSGAESVAKTVHEHMDTVDFEMTVSASWGCRWWSKLYGEDKTEL